jgi:hypothetical protein
MIAFCKRNGRFPSTFYLIHMYCDQGICETRRLDLLSNLESRWLVPHIFLSSSSPPCCAWIIHHTSLSDHIMELLFSPCLRFALRSFRLLEVGLLLPSRTASFGRHGFAQRVVRAPGEWKGGCLHQRSSSSRRTGCRMGLG